MSARLLGIIFQRPSLDKNLTGEENVRFHAILYGLYPYAPGYRLMAAGHRALGQSLAALRRMTDGLEPELKL